jgi:rhodanese-related sulfurtransferase/rubrerythrin
MDHDVVNDLGCEELRRFISQHHERDYLLIDVRQPAEYAINHIPGAILLPLPELEQRLSGLPPAKDLIFYCRSGSRSEVAATLALEAQVTTGRVHHLLGGILEWSGDVLAGLPRIAIFETSHSLPELLYTAMDLERGAWKFYHGLLPRLASSALVETFTALAGAEVGHARLVYSIWAPTQEDPAPFETLFQRLPGAIIEGGQDLATALNTAQGLATGSGLEVIEFALSLELSAFDLYRTAAERAVPDAREALLAIAQAEKGHMRTLIAAIAGCTAGGDGPPLPTP